MKVSELEGATLDYWVAKALNDREVRMQNGRCETRFHPDFEFHLFSPTKAWHEAGPIIERERISLQERDGDCWQANKPQGWAKFGPMPLVAAMRAYVASKFGDEVEDSQPVSAG